MRRLTGWAVAALLPVSMAEEIARMEARRHGSADSQAAWGRRAPPYRHRATAARSLGREVHGLAACGRQRPSMARVAAAASWCPTPPRCDFEIEKEEKTLVFNPHISTHK
jgi:hypothetical protein